MANYTVIPGVPIDFTVDGTLRGVQGPPGDTGNTGATGVGVPVGGTNGQVLSKESGTDYDTAWLDPSGDKYYELAFSPAASVTVTHGLGKYPAVTVIDSAGTEIIGDVSYINNNQLVVNFTATFSGKVLCN